MGDVRHPAREMMLGLRERFAYRSCGTCGALWLEPSPGAEARYYPSSYYAFESRRAPAVRRSLRRFARRLCGPAGGLLALISGRAGGVRAVVRGWPSRQTRVLDVGCGAGELLWLLWELGYRRLAGVDPHLPPAVAQDQPFPIRRAPAPAATGTWDLVVLNHVLEHTDAPASLIRVCAARLAPGGALLVRVPVVPNAAWRRHGVNWVQLDAPRHAWIPTRDAIARLASAAGLTLESAAFDSCAFQFWGSRLYARDIPLHDPRSPLRDGWRAARLLPAVLVDAGRAAWVNRRGTGDQMCFVLRAGTGIEPSDA